MRHFFIDRQAAASNWPRTLRRLGLGVIVVLTVLCGAIFALLWVARETARPAPGDWSTSLYAGPVPVEVGVASLVQWATTPWIARRLDDRTVATPWGPVRLGWDETRQSLTLRCQPCTLRSAVWADAPLRLPVLALTVRRQGAELSGELRAMSPGDPAANAVTARWSGTLRPSGLSLHIDVPSTPLRDGYALFAGDIPEVRSAQIDGSFGLRATLELPSGRMKVDPQLEGMAVQGLGTEQWLAARSQCSQKLPRQARSAKLPVDSLLARAVLAAEDSRFYEHPGYDLTEMKQALQTNQPSRPKSREAEGDEPASEAPRGASTLSQQVAKLVVTGGERSPVRKLRELLYAVEIERTLGKGRILSLYLDHAPWGDGLCGARAAAFAYFGQPVNQITPAQAIWLAAMLHNPGNEARRWAQTGQINVERTQWVLRNLQPLRKAQRQQLQLELAEAQWVPSAAVVDAARPVPPARPLVAASGT